MINNPDIKFYDTSSLLVAGESLFKDKNKFLISSISLKELERIKTSSKKDECIKQTARTLLHLLEENPDNYEIIIHRSSYEKAIEEKDLDITEDMKILSDAIACNNREQAIDRIIFVTNNLSLKNIANLFFGNKMIESV